MNQDSVSIEMIFEEIKDALSTEGQAAITSATKMEDYFMPRRYNAVDLEETRAEAFQEAWSIVMQIREKYLHTEAKEEVER